MKGGVFLKVTCSGYVRVEKYGIAYMKINIALMKNNVYIVGNKILHICNKVRGETMCNKFVVITEIFCGVEKISRRREVKEKLNNMERNQVIKTLYSLYKNERLRQMDVYAKIYTTLKEKYDIDLSERTIIRVVKRELVKK